MLKRYYYMDLSVPGRMEMLKSSKLSGTIFSVEEGYGGIMRVKTVV
jgi:hypothetical protein